MQEIQAWQMQPTGPPFQRETLSSYELAENDVLVEIAGCGVCHTDLSFFYEGVRTVKPPPLTLGHEVSGFVKTAGSQAQGWLGQAVVVPAVMPCGECDLCGAGHGSICRAQKMPGNHIDGGFASHVQVPSRYLCPVDVTTADEPFGDSGVTLKELSVIADAVTTPYQSALNVGLEAGDLAVFIGVGGIGGFGVQIAQALGATVVAIDVDQSKLDRVEQYGSHHSINASALEARKVRDDIRQFVKGRSLSPYRWKIFETSGTKAGQDLAFSLLTFGATLAVVGYTSEKTEFRLSNLMAYNARAIGNWGCHPEHYPAVLELVRQGQIKLGPFVKTFPLDEINLIFDQVHNRQLDRRPVLVPGRDSNA